MTALDPSIHAREPTGHTDHLGTALQHGLPRPMNPKLSWSLVRTFILGGLTGGIVPLLSLPKKFYNFATAEQLQFWHLAEWVRLQTGGPEAAVASEMAHRVAPGFVMRAAALIFTLVAMGIGWTAIGHRPEPVKRWYALIMPELRQDNLPRFITPDTSPSSVRSSGEIWKERDDEDGKHWTDHQQWGVSPQPSIPNDDGALEAIATWKTSVGAPPDLIHAFALAISGAALCWLIEINAHIGRVRRFVGAFNRLSNRYGVGAVRAPGLQLGIRPLWILGGVAMCTVGAYWAMPVMLAGAAHRRYITTTSQRLRSDLARRQREVLLRQRPTLRVPTSVYLTTACPQPNCKAPLPPEAVFCRRCGTRVNGQTA